jgi:ATP-dependent RNA helicase DeaD
MSTTEIIDESPTANATANADATADASAAPPEPKGVRFADLGLRPEVLRALEEMGFQDAMPVQSATVPAARAGRDLMVQSRTGSGKTAAFGIPFVNDIVDPDSRFVQALVLLPTRELALQVAAELARIAAYRAITVAPIYGGAPMGRQIEILRDGAQIVCGTPGRILDHLRRGTLALDRVKCAVLDECDEMLSMGFQEDIEDILERTPESRQTFLFSATVPEGIQRLSRRFLKNPEFLKLSADFIGVNEIRHLYYATPGINREQEFLRVLKFENPKTAIIFCNTREETGRVAEFLQKQGFEAEAISSDLAQSDRERVMAKMRAGQIQFLVATDVAARGIDIEGLTHVFNYTFPEAPEIYIHRTGRTGRAGKHGTAISLIGPTEVGAFYYLKLLYKILPEERALPSETEIRAHREGERVLKLRDALGGEPGSEWRGLARRLISAVDGERLVASLLARGFASVEEMPPAPKVTAAAAPATVGAGGTRAAAEPGRSSGGGGARGPDAPHAPAGFGPAASTSSFLPGPRDARGRSDRGERDRRPREARPEREAERPHPRRERDERDRSRRPARMEGGAELTGERATEAREPARSRGATFGPVVPVAGAPGSVGTVAAASPGTSPAREAGNRFRSAERSGQPEKPEKEFWEIWSEEKSAPGAQKAAVGAGDADDGLLAEPTPSPAASRGFEPAGPTVPDGMARLYLNLGRKDGAQDGQVRDLLREHASFEGPLDIEVMNTHTYLNVPSIEADRLCAALTGKQLGDRDLLCERARPRR